MFQPFSWGAAGEKLSPSQVKKYGDIAAALAARSGAPKTFGEGLNRVGEALVSMSYDNRAAAGEKQGAASRKAVMDALMGNPDPSMADLTGAMGNEWVSSDPGTSAVVQALLGNEIKQMDPAYQIGLETAQLELENLRNPQPEFDFLNVGGELVRTDSAGNAQSVGTFGVPEPGFAPLTAEEAAALGLPPGAYQRGPDNRIHEIGGSGVNVYTGDNSSAFGKKADELAATRLGDVVSAGQGAAAFMGDVKALAALGSQLETGKTAEIMSALGPYAEAVGIEIEGLEEGQAYQAIVDRMAPAMRPAGSGASSDFDARQFLSSLPSLGRTPEGNQIVIETLTAFQEHKMAAAEIASLSFLPQDQGGITWQEAEKRIRELPDPYAGFNDYRERAEAGADPAQPDQSAPVPPPPTSYDGDPALWQFLTPEQRQLWQ